MGTVYLAHDPQLDRKVALKVLRPQHGANSEARARMVREAQAMAKVSHPNIVTVFDTGEAEGSAYIAMELLTGGTLESWLTASPRTATEIVAAFVTAGRALAAAHDAGVVHRDFKPANVLVDRNGRFAVTDFGLAATVQGIGDRGAPTVAARAKLTQPGAIMGTPAYMSPEQYAGTATDARSDQFSFAVALFESLFGVLPFVGNSFEERLARQDWALRPLDAVTMKRAPPRVHTALLRALSRDPAARFPTLHALLDELVEKPAPTATPREVGLIAGGVLALVLTIVGALLVWEHSSASTAGPSAPSTPGAPAAPPTPAAPAAEPVPRRLAELNEKLMVERAKRGGWKVIDARKLEGEILVTLQRGTDFGNVAVYDRTNLQMANLVAESCRHAGGAVDHVSTRSACATIEHDPAGSKALLKLIVP
jgi:hypothetical protein